MKTLVNAVAVSALVLSAAAASAHLPEPGDAGIYADAAGTQSTFNVTTGIPFTIHAVGFDLPGQPAGFEVSFTNIDGLFVLGQSIVNNGLNLGDVPGEFIVAIGACLPGEGAFRMVSITLGDFSGATGIDRAVCMRQTLPTSFPLVPGGPSSGEGLPGYVTCDGTLIPFGVAQNGQGIYPNGCMVLNATQEPISTEAASFGEMKARF